MWGYKPIKCHNCGSRYKITFPSRIIIAALSVLPIILISSLSLSPFNNILLTILFGIVIAVFFTLFIPYLVKYIPD
ncbi:hypothetical protein [Virgibacillus sp. DJP39]|uniref:hypothetical protein n=1 Tax=Virgibacillus sp. DJP39 TaxID=3409790 RepID=UPI003BB649B7